MFSVKMFCQNSSSIELNNVAVHRVSGIPARSFSILRKLSIGEVSLYGWSSVLQVWIQQLH